MPSTRSVFLLTATINPRSTLLLKRRDPAQRESDYLRVLSRLLETTNIPIVWCENSGYPLIHVHEAFTSVPSSRLEILQFESQSDPSRGKGAGELEIEQYAFKHSILLKNAEYVLKLTGRYYVENLAALLTPLNGPRSPFALADFRDGARYTFSGFFVGVPAFFKKYLFYQADFLDDSKSQTMEIALYQALSKAQMDGEYCEHFPESPHISGISGTWNVAMDTKDPNQIAWSWSKLKMLIGYYLTSLRKRLMRSR